MSCQTPGQDRSDLTQRLLDELGAIRGRVYLAGAPDVVAPGGYFRLYREDFRDCGFSVPIDSEGRYRARLMPGTWEIVFISGDGGQALDELAREQNRELTVLGMEERTFDILIGGDAVSSPSAEEMDRYAEGISLSGDVTLRGEGGVARVRAGSVFLQRMDFEPCLFEVPINSVGRYFTSIMPGRYRLLAYETSEGALVDLVAADQAREIDVLPYSAGSAPHSQFFDIELVELE